MAKHYLWAGVALLIAAATLRTAFDGDWSLAGLVIVAGACLLLSLTGLTPERRVA